MFKNLILAIGLLGLVMFDASEAQAFGRKLCGARGGLLLNNWFKIQSTPRAYSCGNTVSVTYSNYSNCNQSNVNQSSFNQPDVNRPNVNLPHDSSNLRTSYSTPYPLGNISNSGYSTPYPPVLNPPGN